LSDWCFHEGPWCLKSSKKAHEDLAKLDRAGLVVWPGEESGTLWVRDDKEILRDRRSGEDRRSFIRKRVRVILKVLKEGER